MTLQVGHIGEILQAIGIAALVRLDSLVGVHMVLKGRRVAKSLAAGLTYEWFFPLTD